MLIELNIHSTIKERLLIIINMMLNSTLTFMVIFVISLVIELKG